MEVVNRVIPFKVVGEVVKASLNPMHPQLAERADRNAAADLPDDEDSSTVFKGFGKGRTPFGSAKEGVPPVRVPLRRRKNIDGTSTTSLESLERLTTAGSALYNSLPLSSSLEDPSPDSAHVPPEFKAAVQALDGGAVPARREALEQMLAHAQGGNASQRDFIAVGALSRLVQALGDADAECRRLAAVTVWSLCFRNGPAARHLGAAGAAEALVHMLGEGSPELLEAATGALCLLALPPANLMGCVNAGAVDALVGVLLGTAPPAARTASGASASSSGAGASGGGGCASPPGAGGAPAAPTEAARRLAASALGNLARVEGVRQRLAGDEAVRSALAGMAGGEEDEEAAEAARQVLARLAGTEERVRPRRRGSSSVGVMA